MRSLPLPIINSSDAFDASVATIRNRTKQEDFKRASATVNLRCEDFDRLAADQNFESARSADFDVPELSSHIDAMSDLYDKQFLKGDRTKAMRDAIKNAASNNLCPYCGDGMTAELDHYLPKSKFAATTVHPPNLVPICRDCNFAKLAYAPSAIAPAVLHPYFDTAFNIKWLSALIEQRDPDPPIVIFLVSFDEDPQLEARLLTHMNVFNLWDKFSIKAAQALDDFQRLLSSDVEHHIDLEAGRLFLGQTAIQRSGGRVNSWEDAAYKAMAASDWYLTKYLGLR